MFVEYRGSVIGIISWQWKYMVFFTASAAAIVTADELLPSAQEALGWTSVDLSAYLRLPALPLGIVGGAIGIFTSFRTNSAYDRWWEGRRLWGQLVNTSRHWCSQVLAYLPEGDGEKPSPLQRRLVERHVAYVHTLRCLLRQQDPQLDPDVKRFLSSDELSAVGSSSNATHLLLATQLREVQAEAAAGRLDALRLQLFDESLRALLDVQGGCERIKKTPFPRGYGFIAERLILAFGLLLPLGLVHDMGWLAIPMSVLVCTAFLLISEVGRVLEDPFTMFWPALPLSALSSTIEINLRERLGERELPALPRPDAKGILM